MKRRVTERGMRHFEELVGDALHLDCGGGYLDFTWVQFLVYTVYFHQIDSKRKKVKTEVFSSHETEFHTEAGHFRSAPPYQLLNKNNVNIVVCLLKWIVSKA